MSFFNELQVINWVGLSYRIPYIVGAKEIFIFLNYEVPLPSFSNKIYIVTLNVRMI